MMNRFRILPALLVAAFAGSGRPTAAVTITVGTAIDVDAGDGSCSLREAILAANTDTAYRECPAGAGADRIVFDLPLPASIDLSVQWPERGRARYRGFEAMTGKGVVSRE